MGARWRGWRVGTAAVAALALWFTVGPAGAPATATHSPADKVVASGSKNVVIAPGAGVSLLTARLRASKPSDLILSVSLECSIFTGLVTGPAGPSMTEDPATDSASATGRIVVWIEVGGKIVPINSTSEPPQSQPAVGDDSDKVTYCDRTYQRTVTDGEDDLDGLDKEDDYIRTKSSHSFDWVRLNLGNGIHDIVVKADLVTSTAGEARATAEVGNRVLVVQPVKLANDVSI